MRFEDTKQSDYAIKLKIEIRQLRQRLKELVDQSAKQDTELAAARSQIGRLIEGTSNLRAELDKTAFDRKAAKGEWAVMARACGNWRTWPGRAEGNHDHPDWQAAARAIMERDIFRSQLAEKDAEIERLNDSLTDAKEGWKRLNELYIATGADLQDIIQSLQSQLAEAGRDQWQGRFEGAKEIADPAERRVAELEGAVKESVDAAFSVGWEGPKIAGPLASFIAKQASELAAARSQIGEERKRLDWTLRNEPDSGLMMADAVDEFDGDTRKLIDAAMVDPKSQYISGSYVALHRAQLAEKDAEIERLKAENHKLYIARDSLHDDNRTMEAQLAGAGRVLRNLFGSMDQTGAEADAKEFINRTWPTPPAEGEGDRPFDDEPMATAAERQWDAKIQECVKALYRKQLIRNPGNFNFRADYLRAVMDEMRSHLPAPAPVQGEQVEGLGVEEWPEVIASWFSRPRPMCRIYMVGPFPPIEGGQWRLEIPAWGRHSADCTHHMTPIAALAAWWKSLRKSRAKQGETR